MSEINVISSPAAASVPEARPRSTVVADHTRVYELDLLRFLAAFSVLLFHYSFRGAARDGFTAFNYPEIAGFSRYGILGVQLFFMISGFVILMNATGATSRRFVISRMVRLYPAFWVCCSLTFLAGILVGGARYAVPATGYLVNLTMLNNYVNVPGVDGVYWTLGVEMRFYLLILLLLSLRQVRRTRVFLGLWLVGAMVWRIYPVRHTAFLLIPDYASCFIAGAAFYLAFSEGWSLSSIALVAGAYWLTLYDCVVLAERLSIDYHQPFSGLAAAAWVTGFFLIFTLIASRRLGRFASAKFMVLGAITYPLYLLHQNIGYMTFNLLDRRVNRHLLFWGVTGAMILTAYAINRFIERRYAGRLRAFMEWVLPQWR